MQIGCYAEMEMIKLWTLRLPVELAAKLRVISRHERRSINGQIVYSISEAVRVFEQAHGEVLVTEEEIYSE